MNAELILLPCYRHHWYGRISPPRRNPSSREQEGRKEKDEEEEIRDDRIFPNKSLHHGIRNRMYALRGQRARYSLVDRRWSIHLTWRSVTRLEYLDRKKIEDQENERGGKKRWKEIEKKIKKSRFIPYHICENSGISETKISICVDMHPRESSLVGSRHASITMLRVFR